MQYPNPVLTKQSNDCLAAWYEFPNNTDKCYFVLNVKSSPRLILVLEKIKEQAHSIFPGMTVNIQPAGDITRILYPQLPPSGFKIKTFNNIREQTQKMYTYWENEPSTRYENKSIKIYIPEDESQPPYIMDSTSQ